MALPKIIRKEDNTELLRQLGNTISLVDPSQMRKQAASNAMSREMLLQHKPDKDHFLIHVIAMGDGERFGPNRNQDFFPKEANQKYHPTFVKNGHFFREHNNTDPALKIGDIKASIHNGDMHRVELAVHGHKKQASDVHEKLQAGENVSFSMSCMVPYDIDNCTGKRCKTANDYEPHMRNAPGQYVPAFKKYAYVINDQPNFFDISFVAKPADRIAHYLDYMQNGQEGFAKAASANSVIPGALLAMADGITVPEHLSTGIQDLRKQAVLTKLANAEEQYRQSFVHGSNTDLHTFVKEAAQYTFSPEDELSATQLSSLRELQPETMFYELAKRASFLPIASFLSYATNTPVEDIKKQASYKLAKTMLPTVFSEMQKSALIRAEDLFDAHEEDFMARTDLSNGDSIQQLLDSVGEKFSVAPECCTSRSIQIRVQFGKGSKDAEKQETKETSEEIKKEASSAILDQAKDYAMMYGLYKVAAVQRMEKFPRYFLDNQVLLRVVSQNNL